MSDDALRLEYVPLDVSLVWENNHKRHDIGGLIQSFQQHGFKDPPKFEPTMNDGNGGIVEGNGRMEALAAMKTQGMDAPRGVQVIDDAWHVPVLFGVDARSEAAAETYGIDHNALTLSGGDFDLYDHLRMWDDGFLGQVEELAYMDETPVVFDGDDLDALLGGWDAEEPADDPGAQVDRAEELREKWGVESGDLWRLGEHRLICGDCTDAEVVARVMDGEKADCVATDPPYGVEYVGKTKDALTIENDGAGGLLDLLRGALDVAFDVSRKGACWYIAAPAGPQFYDFATVLLHLGVWRQTLVWVKNTMVLGHSDYHYKHEVIFYGWKPGAAHHPMPDRTQTTVWEFDKPAASREHPTMKPMGIYEKAIGNSTDIGQLVYEPFSGSGTTLIACERLGRKCRAVEIEPKYVAVALQRWHDMTGEMPERVE